MLNKKPVLDSPVSQNLPYSYFLSDNTMVNKNGEIFCTMKIEGVGVENLTSDAVDKVHHALTRALTDLPSNISIWVNVIRRKKSSSTPPVINNLLSQQFATDYYANLDKQELFSNEYYLSLVLANDKKNTSLVKMPFFQLSAETAKKNNYRDMLKKTKILHQQANQIMLGLKQYNPALLGAKHCKMQKYSEILTFLGGILNFEENNYLFPCIETAQVIPENRIFIGKDTIHLKKESNNKGRLIAVSSMKKYSSFTAASYLSPLLKLPQELIITQIFTPMVKEVAKEQITRQQSKMIQVQDDSISQLESISVALDDLQSDRISFGLHSAMVTTIANSPEQLESNVQNIFKATNNIDIKVVRETINLESAFWAQFPGNSSDIQRKAMISSHNFADLVSFHNVSQGHNGNNHLGKPVIQLETPNFGLFNFNFHRLGSKTSLSVGHTTLIGPTGGGKTTLLCALDSQLRQFGGKSFILDYRQGMGVYVLASGGEYHSFDMGKPTGINPIPQKDTSKSRQYLQQFLSALVIRGEENLTDEDEQIINEAIDGIYNVPVESRNLSTLCSFFNQHWNRYPRIKTWLEREQGSRSYLFDNSQDVLSLSSDVIGFDLTQIMEDKTALLPVMLYLFHRIESSLDGSLTAVIMDEGWQFLNHSYWEKAISAWLATFRKENAFVVFATQNPHEVAQSPLSYGLIQGAATNLYLSNSDAQESDYMDAFKLNAREFEIVSSLNPDEHYFLIKQGKSGSIARCNLQGLDKYISVFSGNQQMFKDVNNLIKNYGSSPNDWLNVYWSKDEK
tara:strand:- start:21786 stop:24164 length:2379 start_codon:yes stop_codon:yes gene_type:complete